MLEVKPQYKHIFKKVCLISSGALEYLESLNQNVSQKNTFSDARDNGRCLQSPLCISMTAKKYIETFKVLNNDVQAEIKTKIMHNRLQINKSQQQVK